MDDLFYIVRGYYKMASIPVFILDENGKSFLFARGYKHEANPLRYGNIMSQIIERAKNTETPFIIIEDDICAYGAMKDSSSLLVVFGPVELKKLSKVDINNYAETRGIPLDDFKITSRSMNVLTAALTTLYFIRFNKEIPEELLYKNHSDKASIENNDIMDYVMQNTEDEVRRISYDAEVDFLNKIRNGDVESLANISVDMDLSGDINLVGRLADKSIKHFEYLVCSSITLAARAAIDGGVEPDTVYLITDLYMRRLEKCSDSVMSILSLHVEMQLDFARQVRDAKESRGRISYVEKCKLFILKHLNKPFTIDELANELNINKAYISRRFKGETGASIMEYTREQRIEAATGMLKFSKKSIADIAIFLCFASQSHFGAVFKKVKGITPQQYRSENQINM